MVGVGRRPAVHPDLHPESTALRQGQAQIASMPAGELAHDGQPQPTALCPGAGGVASLERPGQAVEIMRPDAGAPVSHFEQENIVLLSPPYAQTRPAAWGPPSVAPLRRTCPPVGRGCPRGHLGR